MSESFEFGRVAESFAVEYFTALGYQVLAKNYFSQKAEIDLILQHEDSVVVVEVKARKYKTVILPEEAVTAKKKKLLVKAANDYISKNNIDAEIRFDILALVKKNELWEINHIIDAFNALEL